MAKNRRSTQTEQSIKDGLVRIMASKPVSQISVAELAREAGVSRSSFYTHFGNVEDVYERLVDDFSRETRDLPAQLRCLSCDSEDSATPFCVQVRGSGKWGIIARDPLFLGTYLDGPRWSHARSIRYELECSGVPPAVAEVLLRFQISGCYAVAMQNMGKKEWAQTQRAIDLFIQGGIAALRDDALSVSECR